MFLQATNIFSNKSKIRIRIGKEDKVHTINKISFKEISSLIFILTIYNLNMDIHNLKKDKSN